MTLKIPWEVLTPQPRVARVRTCCGMMGIRGIMIAGACLRYIQPHTPPTSSVRRWLGSFLEGRRACFKCGVTSGHPENCLIFTRMDTELKRGVSVPVRGSRWSLRLGRRPARPPPCRRASVGPADIADSARGRRGAMVIVLRRAPITPINGPSVMRLMAARPHLHNIILIEPEAWHENEPRIMLREDGGDSPAAAICLTAVLINGYPVTQTLTGMNTLTWGR